MSCNTPLAQRGERIAGVVGHRGYRTAQVGRSPVGLSSRQSFPQPPLWLEAANHGAPATLACRLRW